jgi:hypothetical protein
MDVGLDTSAFSDLAWNADRLERFLEVVKTRSARLVIPYVVVHEAADDEDHTRGLSRLALLHRFQGALGSRFIIGEQPVAVVTRERRGRICSTPAHDMKERLLVLLARLDFKDKLPQIQAEIRRSLRKTASLNLDRKFRELLPDKMPDLTSAVFKGRRYLLSLEEEFGIWASPFLSILTKGGKFLQRLREAPRSYPAALRWAGYQHLCALGSGFADIGYGHFHPVLRAPRSGDWVDARVAASTAYCRILVSSDIAQVAKVCHIAAALHLTGTAESLDSFLSP